MGTIRANTYICKKCESRVDDNDNYCRNCGKKLCEVRLAKIDEYTYGR